MKIGITAVLACLVVVLVTGCSAQLSKTPIKPKPTEGRQELPFKDTKWLDDLGFTDAQIKEALASHDIPGTPIDKPVISEAKRLSKKYAEDKTAKPWIIINISGYNPYEIGGNNLWKALWYKPLYLVGYEDKKGSSSFYQAMYAKEEGNGYGAFKFGRERYVEAIGASLILLDEYFNQPDWSYQVLSDTTWVIGHDGEKTAGIFFGPVTYGGMDYGATKKGIVAGRIYEGDELTKTVLEADNLTDHTY